MDHSKQEGDDKPFAVIRSEFVPPPLAIFEQLMKDMPLYVYDADLEITPAEQPKLPGEDEPGNDIFTGGLLP